MWSPNTGAIILSFITDGQGRYVYDYDTSIKILLGDAHPDGTWKFLEATAYSPVNANGLYLWAMAVDTGSNVTLSVGSAEYGASRLALGGYGYVSGTDWIMLKRGASRDLKWVGQNGDEDEVDIVVYGYSIER